jgi:FtsP/CotA-like multicopper oxidase with cupredoxin domain
VLDVRSELMRFRILNGANSRIFDLVFADRREFRVIASDSGFLPAPVTVDHLQRSPGERFEILVRMTPGESVLLQSQPPDLGTLPLYGRLIGGDDHFDLLELRAASTLQPATAIPDFLPSPPPVTLSSYPSKRSFSLGTRSINGNKMQMDRIDFVVPLGPPEIWTVKNAQGIPHNFHVHNAMFQVMEIDGHAPSPEFAGFKDTVYVPPLQTVKFAVRFGQFADPHTPYMVHCHLLAHEDSGMMQQFVMVEPGTEDQVPMVLPAASPVPGHEHGM